MSRPAYMALTISLYMVAMTVVAWAVWQIMPPVVNWMETSLGFWPTTVLTLGIIPLGWSIAYFWGRKPSGTALDP